MSGLETIERIAKLKNLESAPTIIMISGHATLADAVRATKAGAYDLIEKPLDRERLMVALRNALERRAMEREVQGLRAMTDERFEMVGKSAPMAALFAQIAKVAPTRTRVLITGETGTGKELIARAIHRASALADKPFVKVNCAAIPPELIESELFGHERGAFTGATARKRGLFELADGGTIFLDEIGDMLAVGAGQGAARAAVGRVHARRRRAGAEGRRARRRRHQPRPAGGGRGGRVPRGSVLPPERRAAARAAAARARRGRAAAVAVVRRAGLPRERHEGRSRSPTRRWRCWPPTRGRATCASCAT